MRCCPSAWARWRPGGLARRGGSPRSRRSGGWPARSLLLLSPGGPGLPQYWVTAGLALAALAALLLTRQRTLVTVGWSIALLGLAISVLASRVLVTPAGGGPAIPAWPGIALAVAAAGLLLAATVAGGSLPDHLAGGKWHGARG